MLMLCLVFAVAGPVMPGAGDVSPMDPTMAYGAAPNMLVFAPAGGAGLDLGLTTKAVVYSTTVLLTLCQITQIPIPCYEYDTEDSLLRDGGRYSRVDKG